MTTRSSDRPAWGSLPRPLRDAVEGALGSAIVSAESRPGGWSPGSADLVGTADGRAAFVKAASADVNATTVALHRREADVLRLLDGGPAPRLLAAVDDPPWFALVVEAIDGRHPDPGSAADTAAVLDAVAALPDAPAGALGGLVADLEDVARGWVRLREDAAPLPDPVRLALPGLIALAARVDELDGDSVVHGDLRAAPSARPTPSLRAGAGPRRALGPTCSSTAAGARGSSTGRPPSPASAGSTPSPTGSTCGTWAATTPPRCATPCCGTRPPRGWTCCSPCSAPTSSTGRAPPEPPGLTGIRAYQRAQGGTVLAALLERRPDLLP